MSMKKHFKNAPDTLKVHFKRSVSFSGAPGRARKDFAIGVHEVPKEILQHKFFHKLVKAGFVCEPEAHKIVKPVSLEEKQNKLLDVLHKRQAAAKAAAAPAPESEDPEKGADESEEQGDFYGGEESDDTETVEDTNQEEGEETALDSEDEDFGDDETVEDSEPAEDEGEESEDSKPAPQAKTKKKKTKKKKKRS